MKPPIDRRLQWSDVPEDARRIICNGCGRKGGIIKPPNFLFTASCDQHDFYYWRGGTEVDRLKADKGFYEAMRVDVKGMPLYRRPFYHVVAYVYYRAVRRAGAFCFSYGRYKTLSDIKRAVD